MGTAGGGGVAATLRQVLEDGSEMAKTISIYIVLEGSVVNTSINY